MHIKDKFIEACKNGELKIVKALLEHNKQTYIRIEFQHIYSGFLKAYQYNHPNIIDFLCGHVNYTKKVLIECLEAACEGKSVKLVDSVIKMAKAREKIRNIKLDYNKSLNISCNNGCIELVNKMIENGANNWDECLISACMGGSLDIFKLIVEKRTESDKSDKSDKSKLYEVELLARSLKTACICKNVEIVRYIIDFMIISKELQKTLGQSNDCDSDSDCDNRDYYHSSSSLQSVCSLGEVDLVNKIIQLGFTDWNGGLSEACFRNHMEIIKLMIAKGAYDWNRGFTTACIGGHIDVVKFMVQKCVTDYSLNIGFNCACSGNHCDIINFILSVTTSVSNIVDLGSFYNASICGSLETLDILLSLDIDFNTPSYNYPRETIFGVSNIGGVMNKCKNAETLQKFLYSAKHIDQYSTFNIHNCFDFACFRDDVDTINVLIKYRDNYLPHVELNLSKLEHLTDFRLYCMYCRHISDDIGTDLITNNRLNYYLQIYPVYVVLLCSKVGGWGDGSIKGGNNLKRLPVELIRYLHTF